MKVEEALEKEKKKRLEQIGSSNEMQNNKQLLLEEFNDDVKLMRELGIDHEYKKAKELEHEVNSFEVVSNMYDGLPSISVKQLRDFCQRYNLMFIRIDEYRGKVSQPMLQGIREFMKKHSVANPQKLFYILCPKEQSTNTVYDKNLSVFFIDNVTMNELYDDMVFVKVYDNNVSFNESRIFRNMSETAHKDAMDNAAATALGTLFIVCGFILGMFFFIAGLFSLVIGTICYWYAVKATPKYIGETFMLRKKQTNNSW